MLDTQRLLTDRWLKLKHHNEQQRYWSSLARFNVVPAGRRSGKTEIAKRKLVKRAIKGTSFDDPRFFAGAPTRDQSKRIFWDDLKKLTPRWLIQETRESDLCIKLLTGSQIWVVGLDKPERIEGQPWDGGILDEYANMKESAFTANIRPALSDRQGWCDLIGVPEGRNHYYERYRYAMDNDDPEWQAFHWVSADILPASEIEAARRDLDEQTFDQEYNASFLYFRGRAYYPFNEHTHCARLGYDPQRPLILCFDFNVDPGVAAICQEQRLPNGLDGTGVIGEVYIPTNSNTPAVCQRIIQDWGKHEGYVLCYGDATGGNRGSAKTSGSDWDLIRMELRPVFGPRLKFNVPAANPPERSRINAVNTRLLSGDGKIRMMIDGAKAPYTVKDFEGTQLLNGGSGQIDKKKDLKLSHLTDGLGYFVAHQYPIYESQITSSQTRMA